MVESGAVNSAARVEDGHGAHVDGRDGVGHDEGHPEDVGHVGGHPKALWTILMESQGVPK